MTAGLHRDFLQLGVGNALTRPGGVSMLGSPVDLAAIDLDSYLVAGITDHICPWQSCYRSTQLLGGNKRFVLSTSGHIAAMVNPPGESPAPVMPYHLAALAPLLTGLLDRLGVARADVLGISWGGGLAQQLALSRPDRVHRLMLVATGPGALMVPGHPKCCCGCSRRGASSAASSGNRQQARRNAPDVQSRRIIAGHLAPAASAGAR